eukprot:gene10059-3137_t
MWLLFPQCEISCEVNEQTFDGILLSIHIGLGTPMLMNVKWSRKDLQVPNFLEEVKQ